MGPRALQSLTRRGSMVSQGAPEKYLKNMGRLESFAYEVARVKLKPRMRNTGSWSSDDMVHTLLQYAGESLRYLTMLESIKGTYKRVPPLEGSKNLKIVTIFWWALEKKLR